MGKGPIQGIAMRKTLHTKEGLEFTDRGTVTQQQPNLSSRFEVKEKHRDPGEGKACEGIHDLLRISGVSDLGEQRGKNHRRNGGGCARERGSTPVALPFPFLRGQKFPLGLGHLCHETLEQLPFLDPSLYLLPKFYRDIYGTGAFFFLRVKRATSWRGPSAAHRHRGLPHRFLVRVREACTKGFIFLR